jgi:tetratricopeptide (TPR) repeat protein
MGSFADNPIGTMTPCPLCRDPNLVWKNVDSFRIKPEGMSLCMSCGFVSYPSKVKSKAEIIAHYKGDTYRPAPTVTNRFAGERKLHYHAAFLKELFDAWKAKGVETPVVCEVGAAFGMVLNWIRSIFPKGEYSGTELTQSFVRNAWHLYNLKLEDDYDDTKKYDLLISYKVLEHQCEPDIELARMLAALKDDGVLYLGVPVWWKAMNNFGAGGFDLEYYFSPDHINTWGDQHVRGLVEALGGEIFHENHTYYDSAFLIKRKPGANPLELQKTGDRTNCKIDPQTILGYLEKIQKASDAYNMGEFKKAFEIWPNFPIAYSAHYEHNRPTFDKLGFDAIYKGFCLEAIKACPNDASIQIFTGDICCRYDQYELALEHAAKANELSPNMPNVFIMLGNVYRTMAKHSKTPEDKLKFLENARRSSKLLLDTSSQHRNEAISFIMNDNARLPTPWEIK